MKAKWLSSSLVSWEHWEACRLSENKAHGAAGGSRIRTCHLIQRCSLVSAVAVTCRVSIHTEIAARYWSTVAIYNLAISICIDRYRHLADIPVFPFATHAGRLPGLRLRLAGQAGRSRQRQRGSMRVSEI